MFLIIALLCLSLQVFGQKLEKTQVLTLGLFHFNFPNQDIVKTEKDSQINVLESKYQKEIELIVKKMAKFKPTIIVIERQPEEQVQTDTDYNNYLQGRYELKKDESEQIGFRLAKLIGLKKLYCIDAWGEDYENINKFFENKDSPETKKFLDYLNKNPDIEKGIYENTVFKTKGILAELKRLNSPEYQSQDLGNYLTGAFKYEIADSKYFGVDFTTGWWFNRNLRIFRHIQKIGNKPTDKIFVIFGAGHMNLLNLFFNSSPDYKLLKTKDFLK